MKAGLAVHEVKQLALPPALSGLLVPQFQVCHVAANTTLYRQGDKCTGLYFVLSGLLSLSVQSANGAHSAINSLAVGSWFGDLGVHDGLPQAHTCLCLESARVAFLPAKNIQLLLQQEHDFAVFLTKIMARRLRTCFNQVATSRLTSLPQQLALQLINLAVKNSAGVAEVKLSQQNLADLLGVSRFKVQRELKPFIASGWIVSRYGTIEISQPHKLLQFADSQDFIYQTPISCS